MGTKGNLAYRICKPKLRRLGEQSRLEGEAREGRRGVALREDHGRGLEEGLREEVEQLLPALLRGGGGGEAKEVLSEQQPGAGREGGGQRGVELGARGSDLVAEAREGVDAVQGALSIRGHHHHLSGCKEDLQRQAERQQAVQTTHHVRKEAEEAGGRVPAGQRQPLLGLQGDEGRDDLPASREVLVLPAPAERVQLEHRGLGQPPLPLGSSRRGRHAPGVLCSLAE